MSLSSSPNWTASLRQAIATSDAAREEGMWERRAVLERRRYADSVSAAEVPLAQQLLPRIPNNLAAVDAEKRKDSEPPMKQQTKKEVEEEQQKQQQQPSFYTPDRRAFAYRQLCAPPMTHYADNHYLQDLLQWCAARNVFIHPALEITHERSAYRDFAFRLRFPVPRHTPLIAVPEELVIGFKEDVSDFDRNALFDAQKETNFFKANHGSDRSAAQVPALSNSNTDSEAPHSDADICDFFFYCLGTIVADLVTAQSSQLTDGRHEFAKNLTRIRTLQNAPYLPENIVFASKKEEGSSKPVVVADKERSGEAKKAAQEKGKEKDGKKENVDDGDASGFDADASSSLPREEEECCLADILLQMIRNYLNGGPLVGKLDRADLMAAVSMCLSHSTPLVIGPRRSIGIVPLVHLFPHGGTKTNAVVLGRPDDNIGQFRELIKEKRRRCTPPALLGGAESAEEDESDEDGDDGAVFVPPPTLIRGEAAAEGGGFSSASASPSASSCAPKSSSDDCDRCDASATPTARSSPDSAVDGGFVNVSAPTTANNKPSASDNKKEKKKQQQAANRNQNISAALEMAEYFTALTGYDFASSIITPDEYAQQQHQQRTTNGAGGGPKAKAGASPPSTRFTKGFVYVVALRDMAAGEAAQVQAMAPVCGKEEESSHMWQLSCGTAPAEYLATSVVAEASRLTLVEILGGQADE